MTPQTRYERLNRLAIGMFTKAVLKRYKTTLVLFYYTNIYIMRMFNDDRRAYEPK